MGRQPWIVYYVLRTRDAISVTVGGAEILFSIILLSIVYALLFVAWLYLLRRHIARGPSARYWRAPSSVRTPRSPT